MEVELLPGFETATGTDELLVEIVTDNNPLTNDYPGGEGIYEAYGYYRYGFNGKENDNEVKGTGNQQDYGMRIYDPRLGRFLSVDPLTKSFPWNSTYAFAENDVLRNIDLDGEEKKHYLLVWDEQHRNATLTYSRDEDFTETTSTWTPTLTNWLNTTKNTVKNPRVEYVVHGSVSVPHSESGMFVNEEVTVTWTFKTSDEMFAAQKHKGKGLDSKNNDAPFEFSDKWGYASSDQRWSIAGSQVLTYSMEAQGQKVVRAPNFAKGQGTIRTPVVTEPREVPIARGMNNPIERNAANVGNRVHYDQMNGGPTASVGCPTELQMRYRHTVFQFTGRGAKGADVKVVGGMHPSLYPGSNWAPGNMFGDFKPGTASGRRTFSSDVRSGKLPSNTQQLNYDPVTGQLQ